MLNENDKPTSSRARYSIDETSSSSTRWSMNAARKSRTRWSPVTRYSALQHHQLGVQPAEGLVAAGPAPLASFAAIVGCLPCCHPGQRSSIGTPASADEMCMPHPAHVAWMGACAWGVRRPRVADPVCTSFASASVQVSRLAAVAAHIDPPSVHPQRHSECPLTLPHVGHATLRHMIMCVSVAVIWAQLVW